MFTNRNFKVLKKALHVTFYQIGMVSFLIALLTIFLKVFLNFDLSSSIGILVITPALLLGNYLKEKK